jgi:hypothetical protein
MKKAACVMLLLGKRDVQQQKNKRRMTCVPLAAIYDYQ